MGERILVRLGDCVDLVTGFPFKSQSYTKEASGIRLLRGDNIVQGSLRWDGVRRWPLSDMSQYSDYELAKDDVVLAMDRPWIEAGLKYAPIGSNDLPSLLVQRVARLRALCVLDQRFLRYVIGGRGFTDHVLSVQTGTAVPHISGDQIREYKFELPELSVQRAIAEVLGALDDKIEANRRVVSGLDRAISGTWEQATSGEEDWPIEHVGEVARIVGGSTPRTSISENWDGPFAWATPKDLSRLPSIVLLKTERTITSEGLSQISSGLLPEGTVLLSSRAPIGYLAIAELPVAVNQGFIALVPTGRVSNLYLWQWIAHHLDDIKDRANGTTFLEISKASFRPMPFSMPPAGVCERWTDVADAMYRHIVGVERETLTLASLRDTLLPKLMSGELRVREAEELVEDAV